MTTIPFARCLSRNMCMFRRSISFSTRCTQHKLIYNPFRQTFLNKYVYEPRCVVRLFSTDRDINPKKNVPPVEVKLGLFQRFKQMYRDYWYVLVPVHLVTSIGWFGSFYYMAKSGVDIVALMQNIGFSEKFTNPLRDSSMGYIAISYALYKIATPLRYTVTLGGTTISINYLKEWGYIKPVPSTDQLKEMYKERRDNLKESLQEQRDNLKGTIQERRDHLKEAIQGRKDHLKETFQERSAHFKETYEEKKEELRQRKVQLKESLQETKAELRQAKDQLSQRKDNIIGDYATFKQELKDIKTKNVSKVASPPPGKRK